MKNEYRAFVVGAALIVISQLAAVAQERTKPPTETPVGAWRGESKCMVQPSSCNDEDSLYRFSAGKPRDAVRLSANKIVAGREVNMGESDCRYDSSARAVDCPLPNGSAIHFEFNGTLMDGKMTMRDGTLWRKISLRKIKEK